MMEISKKREDRIIVYLREYVKLCKKHLMYVTGAIGADTALWDDKKYFSEDTFEGDLRVKIEEMVYGGLGGPGLYTDDGNHTPPKEQLDRILGKVLGTS